jgi:hypothetical protein
MARKTIKMKVDRHTNGNLTLKESIGGDIMPTDAKGALLLNSDPGSFYRAVAKRIAKRAKDYKVKYQDTST